MDLTHHRVFVTGGTRGIGLALARALTARGAAVAICGRSAEGIAEAREQLPSLTTLQCDLGDLEVLPSFVAQLRSTFGAPTILVNNAGIQFNHEWPTTDTAETLARLTTEIGVNLTSPLALTALLLPDLLGAREAAVVNVSSLLALAPKRSAPVYCATKAAIRSFSQALRYQLAAHPSVRVVEVLPPLVDTGMTVGRGTGKISAARAADEIVRGMERDADEIYVGKGRLLRVLHRLAPGAAARLLRAG